MRKEVKQLQEIIEKSKNILITTHNQPDTDALASLSIVDIAIRKHLKKTNTKSVICITSKVSKFDWNILKTAQVRQMEEVTDLTEFDLIIMTDAHQIERCIPNHVNLSEDTILVGIEHHELIPEAVEKLTLNFNEFRSSAAEEAYRVFREMLGEEFARDEEVVMLTQMGIASDTGRFLFPNTHPETYEIMSELIRIKKMDMEDFTNNVSQLSVGAIKATEILLRSFTLQDGWGYMVITNEDTQREGLKEFDKESACGHITHTYLRTIAGTTWGFVMSQFKDEPEKWKVSLRANNNTREVVKIAKELGGGGHRFAAGANIEAPSKQKALEKIFEAIKKTS